MVSKIWGYFIVVGLLFSLLSGNAIRINETILTSARTSLELLLQIFPVVALWLGIANIATLSGLLGRMSRRLARILGPLFPEIPKEHITLSYIASNLMANMFGLGSAATPFGLKAMSSLQELNKDKKTASRSMITFTTLNTSFITIVPATIIALRIMHGSVNPTITVVATLIATSSSTVVGIIVDRLFARRNHE